MTFHVNGEGVVSVCTATVRPCPLGADAHGETEEACRKIFEEKMGGPLSPSLKKASAPSYQAYGFSEVREGETYHERLKRLQEADFSMAEALAESQSQLASMTEDERKALKIYQSSAYRAINQAMSRGDLPTPQLTASLKDVGPAEGLFYLREEEETPEVISLVAHHLTAALKKGEPRDRTVYRGKAYNSTHDPMATQEGFDALPVGGTITSPIFTSTSYLPEAAAHFGHGGVFYEIKARRGLNVAGATTAGWTEFEVLLPPNTTFTVVGKHLIPDERGITNRLVQLVEGDPASWLGERA